MINKTMRADTLGNAGFKREYGIKYAYLSGAMYRGIASKELVVKMGKANLMGYLGTAGMSLGEIEQNINYIQQHLSNDDSYGMNILCDLDHPAHENATVELYMKHGIRYVEAAAYIQITLAIVLYRLKGLRKTSSGEIVCDNHVMAKVSRPEVASIFMSPPPENIVKQLLSEGKISAEQAQLAQYIPVSSEVCVEADSGGHTDMGIPTVIFPAMKVLRDRMVKQFNYPGELYIGLAGGIGSPEAAAAAFVMGADFILTGSINQCTVEAGTSDAVKDILQDINVQDTDYAPAGDMFEIGAKVQVLKQSVFFAARSNKLYALYMQYGGLDELPAAIQKQLQERYFKRSFDDIWNDVKTYLNDTDRADQVALIEANPKQKMARVFKWYFAYTTELALRGDTRDRVNFQVHTGPALGSFNQWLKGTELESWRARHVDEIAEKLMDATAEHFSRLSIFG